MKKTFLLMLLCAIAQGMFAQFAYPRLIAHGIVHFKDGTQQEFEQIKLSGYDLKNVYVKDDDGNRSTLSKEDVIFFEVWNDKLSEPEHFIFVYATILKSYAGWGVVSKAGEHLWLVEQGKSYQLLDSGVVRITSEMFGISFYKPATGESLFANFPFNKKLRQRLADFFSDDPVIRDYIMTCDKKTYNAQYILDNYNP